MARSSAILCSHAFNKSYGNHACKRLTRKTSMTDLKKKNITQYNEIENKTIRYTIIQKMEL
ncbi:hypothetical protein BpHYR1_022625 [Brachionus plicatilis]|uniref:Uncharacterized protein n=1 Tax=Brachionus plicatilis TaxID=10195 RepID=A0A3M7RXZ3_BRAPC|nr:hypothetical protein BpHYR1_022625 [Brachionus plicatilis]